MRIWIARPEPGATRTARQVAGLGHDPLVAPVLEMVPTGDALPIGPFDGLIVTSANAFSIAAPLDVDPIPVFCVGSRTAQAARKAGLEQVHNARGDASTLARLVQTSLPVRSRLLHLAGAERKAEPAASLTAAGYAVTIHVAYAMHGIPRLPAPVAEALGERTLHAALHYSARSAETALALAISAGCDGAFRSLTHYCLSADVAAPLVAGGCLFYDVSEKPSEECLLARLAG